MNNVERLNLLAKSLWKKEEAKEYSGLARNYLTKIFKKCQHPEFPMLVFRDKFLKEIGTSTEKEIALFSKGGDSR